MGTMTGSGPELRRAVGQVRRTASDLGIGTALRFGGHAARFWATSISPTRFVIELTRTTEEDADAWLSGGLERAGELQGAWVKGSGAVSPGDFAVLYAVTRAARPTRVLETGTRAGVSTSAFAHALKENGDGGVVHTVDWARGMNAEGESYRHQVGELIPPEVEGQVRFHQADVRETLPTLLEELAPNLVLFDDVHYPEHHAWEARTALSTLPRGTIVMCDDVTVGWARATGTWRNCRFMGGVVV